MADWPHVARVPLRWADLDAQGHVNNALVADYLQEARASLLRTGANPHLLGGGVVVVGHRVEYLRPITFAPEPLEVAIGVVRVEGARFTFAYEVRQDDAVCARATSALCPFDFATQRPRRLTAAERDAFAALVVAEPAFRPLEAPRLHGRGHRYPVSVRWTDLDSYGHVNNVRLFDFVQEARIAMTTAADPSMARDGSEGIWFVARQDVDYLAQMDARPEPYLAHTAPVALGTSSSTYACEVTDPTRDGLVVARARTVLVHANTAGRPEPLPQATRDLLQGLLVA